ncbi:MAG TPA: hypothetical protein VE753_09220 [Gaiellaceae bacterium]|nr:hypothetical protein [Gaiellaceae bacterium]
MPPAAAGSAIVQSTKLREELLPFAGFTSPVPYPDGNGDEFPKRLAGCVTVRAPGMYDPTRTSPARWTAACG